MQDQIGQYKKIHDKLRQEQTRNDNILQAKPRQTKETSKPKHNDTTQNNTRQAKIRQCKATWDTTRQDNPT